MIIGTSSAENIVNYSEFSEWSDDTEYISGDLRRLRNLKPVYTPCARIHTNTRATVALKVQTCLTFKAAQTSAGIPANHESCPRSPRADTLVCIGMYADVYRRIRSRCLYLYPRHNLHYAVATHRQTQAWTFAPAVGANARMEYKAGFTVQCRLGYWDPWVGIFGIFQMKRCTYFLVWT